MKKTLSVKIATLLILMIGMVFSLRAQTTVPFTFSGTSPVALQMDSYGNLSSIGTFGTGTFSLAGAGTRMFWYPGKAAFRAGYVSGTQWNDTNIGNYSTAIGNSTTASGLNSVTIGSFGNASGSNSLCLGNYGNASGANSTALSGGYAGGSYSVSMGSLTNAIGYASLAMGQFDFAQGSNAIAMGFNANALGDYSTVFGSSTNSSAYNSFVIGKNNIGGGNATSWVATDPLFEIGNGSTTASDALVVYKNGNMNVQGVLSGHSSIRCSPGGDLSMGSFTAGTHP